MARLPSLQVRREWGPWQSEEVYAFLQEFIRRKCPVIPVILPNTQTQPRLPVFLRNRHWVDFRLQEPEPLSQFIWGVTGEKTSEKILNVAEMVSVQSAEQFLSTQPPVLDAKYADLEHYLKSGQWREADEETCRLMVLEVGKGEEDWWWLGPEDLFDFPRKSLKAINGLWIGHSGGKFGFSVQKEIYLNCGGRPDGCFHQDAWIKLKKMVGWIGSVEYDFEQSYRGHLPAFGRSAQYFSSLLSHPAL